MQAKIRSATAADNLLTMGGIYRIKGRRSRDGLLAQNQRIGSAKLCLDISQGVLHLLACLFPAEIGKRLIPKRSRSR